MSQTALITGASYGIGYELSKLFAKDGFNLVLIARDKDRLHEVSEELKSMNKINVTVIAKDLSKQTSPREISDELSKEKIKIDILVNNAGFGNHGAFTDTNLQQELDMIQVNITALTHLTKLFLPQMVERKNGKILNIASMAAFQPGPFMSVYYATKAYVLSFSEAISEELKGTGVTVTTLCPGPTITEFQSRAKIDSIRLMKTRLLNSMSAKDVAEIGYKGLMRGKALIIPGIMNKIGVQSLRLAPRSLVKKIVRLLNLPR